jgi:hypothetical protein
MRRVKVFKLTNYKIIFAVVTVIILVTLIASACNIFGEPPQETEGLSGIVAPPQNTQVLMGSPVQVQTVAISDTISRVELWVNDQLIRADLPDDGTVLQEWTPDVTATLPVPYTITVRGYITDAVAMLESINVVAVPNSAVSLLPPQREVGGEEGIAFEPPTPTPTIFPNPTIVGIEAIPTLESGVATSTVTITAVDIAPVAVDPTPTPPLRYPPPPPVPGVPPGPTQDQLPLLYPPVCDQAEYVGVYAASTTDRITINEDDDVAALTAGGTQVFRAWRLRNTGTCTWGPGYELAFYGGRSMGSGGVAFESIFPSEPGRRNALVDGNRLIVPEGKPNQVAVVEVMLNIPSTPGVHQSYWRMRNPQGIYFGPIIGVTLEVVRQCEFGIYGAPVINYFNILGVGDVYQPEDPVDVLAEFGDTITLEWDVINTNNFDVVLTDPLGRVSALSNTAATGRAQFIVSELGNYTVTLYADNGPCTVSQDVTIIVVPRGEDRFQLDIILSPTSATANVASENVGVSEAITTGNIIAQWQHFDPEANQFALIAQLYRRVMQRQCPFVDSIFGWTGHCYRDWTEWMPTGQRRVIPTGQEAEGAVVITNVETDLCPTGFDPNSEEYGIKYVMEAGKNGQPASPQYSNAVDVLCGGVPSTSTGELPVEIQSTFNP